MNEQKIVWFQDGMKLGTHPKNWGQLDALTSSLIQSFGHLDFAHEIIDPIKHLARLIVVLPENPTCIIDLTSGKIAQLLQGVFDSVTFITDLHLSRLRVVSSPRLDGSGFLLNKSADEFRKLHKFVDLSKTVILDDVGWSGRSVVEVCRLVGLAVDKTTFGFITGNHGMFTSKKGAVGFIESLGGTVLVGGAVATPSDDGFHIADFFDSTKISHRQLLSVLTLVQQLREQSVLSPKFAKEVEMKLQQVFKEASSVLFPNALDANTINELILEGKIVGINGVPKNALFQTNPLNWLLPSFSKRVRSEDMIKNFESICSILDELGTICKEGSNSRVEGNQLGKERL